MKHHIAAAIPAPPPMSFAPFSPLGDEAPLMLPAPADTVRRPQAARQAAGIMIVSSPGQDDPTLTALLAGQTTGPIGLAALDPDAGFGCMADLRSGYDVILLNLDRAAHPALLCRQMARAGIMAAIVVLSPRDESPEIVGALDAGAVDYIIKPYRRYEFAARIRNAIRGTRGRLDPSTNIGPYWFSSQTRTLTVRHSGRSISLSTLEADVLKALLREPGHAVSREALEVRLWTNGTPDRRSTLSTIVWRLRRKLASEPDGPHILRHSRAGYTLLDWIGTPAKAAE